jgi:hypothetical protein
VATAATSTTREARWLGGRLRGLTPPLPVYRDAGKGTARHIVYTRQGGTDITNLAGTILVRSAWLVYVSQPVPQGSTVYVEDLEADADRMHEAIYKPSVPAAVNGRYIEECRRDVEHYLPVYEGTTLTELQLGAIYIIYTSLA